MAKDETKPQEAPAAHPDPDRWWLIIERMALVALAIITAQLVALIWVGSVGDNVGTQLTIINLTLAGCVLSFTGGTWTIDLVKAWRHGK